MVSEPVVLGIKFNLALTNRAITFIPEYQIRFPRDGNRCSYLIRLSQTLPPVFLDTKAYSVQKNRGESVRETY
jgi:hypothetical protein